MFGLRRNQTGGARTLAHLQEGPTAKKKGPSKRGQATQAAGLSLPCCRVTTAGVVYGSVAQGQGQPADQGGNSGWIVFTPLVKTPTMETSYVPAVVEGLLVQGLTPF